MARVLTCEICGSVFECGAPGLCWCSGVKLGRVGKLAVSSMARDCVCRNCLGKAASL